MRGFKCSLCWPQKPLPSNAIQFKSSRKFRITQAGERFMLIRGDIANVASTCQKRRALSRRISLLPPSYRDNLKYKAGTCSVGSWGAWVSQTDRSEAESGEVNSTGHWEDNWEGQSPRLWLYHFGQELNDEVFSIRISGQYNRLGDNKCSATQSVRQQKVLKYSTTQNVTQ